MTDKAEATRAAGFKEGAEVAFVYDPLGRAFPEYRLAKVGKVLKNGNFTIAGDKYPQQYRRFGDEVAFATGDARRFSRERVRLVTPETLSAIRDAAARTARVRRLDRVAVAIEAFRKARDVQEDILSALETVLDVGGVK